MSIPSQTKTWQFDLNNPIGSSQAAMLLSIKNKVTGFGSNPWTVAGSSNASTAGMDGVDRWSGTGDITRSTSTTGSRSWMVFDHPAGFQMLFDYRGSSAVTADIYISPRSLFVSGSTTARPTATDEFYQWDTNNTATDPNTGWSNTNTTYFDIMHSSDGRMTYLVMFGTFGRTDAKTLWCVGRPENVRSDWTTPYVAYFNTNGGTNNSIDGASWGRTSGGPTMRTEVAGIAGANSLVLAVSEMSDTRELFVQFNRTDDINLLSHMAPVGLACWDNRMWGRIGDMPDLFFTAPARDGLNTFGSKTWVQAGYFLLPWDGATDPIAS